LVGRWRRRWVGRVVTVRQVLGSQAGDLEGAVGQQNGGEVAAEAFRVLERANARAAKIDTCVLGAGEGAKEQLGAVLAFNHLRQSSDRRGATGFESCQKGALCSHAGTGVSVVQRCQCLDQV
jgi:hypothetical protein